MTSCQQQARSSTQQLGACKVVHTCSVDQVQQFAKDLAPWLALGGSILALLTAISRLRGSVRLRSNLAADAEIYQNLPTGSEARVALGETLDHQARVLRRRVVDGVQPNGLQLMMLIGLMLFLSGLLVALMLDTAPTGIGFFDNVMKVSSAVIGSTGLLAVGFGLMGQTVIWLHEHAMRVFDDEEDLSFARLTQALSPRRSFKAFMKEERARLGSGQPESLPDMPTSSDQ